MPTRLKALLRVQPATASIGAVAQALVSHHISGTTPLMASMMMIIGSRARHKPARTNGRRPYLSDSSPTSGAQRNVMTVCAKKSLHDDQ